MSKRSQERSEKLLERAERVIPGGVNSPVRAFRHVQGKPLFISRGEGPYLIDADGNRYIDYVGSWGPLILGHNHAAVRNAVLDVLERGTSFGAPTELEVQFAELLCGLIPNMELVRFVSSGTEATMSAIRLARGFTGRELLLKFNGCYHGHADSLLIQAGSGVATLGISGSKGVLDETARKSVSVEFNDLELFERTIKEHGPEKFAAVIIEPVPGNMGLVLPRPEFLKGVRELCSQHGIVLIFDEVMTGFRVGLQGAQARFNIQADVITLGKVIGGGLPVGAFGGRKDIMEQLAPLGPVYQAGTLSGNPLAMSAGMAAVKYLKEKNPYPRLEELATRWETGLKDAAQKHGIALQVAHCCSMLGFFFSADPVFSYADASRCDKERFIKFFWGMLDHGVYLAPSAFEAGFLSVVHDEKIVDETIVSASEVFGNL